MVQANKYDIDWISILYLELVDELVNDLPQPLVGQLKVDGGVGGQDVVEELAVVVIALEPLLDSGATLRSIFEFTWHKTDNQVQGANLNSSVDVAEVELPASDMFKNVTNHIDLKITMHL